MKSYEGKRILVVGAARSGVSAAKLLRSLGAYVALSDSKTEKELPEETVRELSLMGIHLYIGKNVGEELVRSQNLIISSPGIPSDMVTFKTARSLGIKIMGEMELAFTLCPCPTAAITGTNGKTTTVALAGEIIGRHIRNTKVAGNIGRPFTECVGELVADGFAVIEASSFQLENISVFKPKIAAILNVTPDHLDRHKTFDKYIEAKTNVYKYTDENCTVILNGDAPILKALNIKTGAKTLRFSLSEPEDAYLKGDEIILKHNDIEECLINVRELRIPGRHNIMNALAASLTAVCAGVPFETIALGLAEFKGVPHRIELVRELNGVRYYNDSKGTNPEASIKALEAMSGKTVLIAGGYDKKASFAEFAKLFGERLSHLVVIGETKSELIEACEKAGFKSYSAADGLESAVAIAAEKAKNGENVLLSPACASWDMFPDYEKRGERFKTLVNEL